MFTGTRVAVVFFAEESGVIVGVIGGHLGPPMLASPTIPFVGSIAICWVEPQHRRLGIAKRLVERIENWFREKQAPYVDVDYMLRNTVSGEVWQALDFEPYRAVARKPL